MKTNNYYDLVNRKEIADSVEWWNGKGAEFDGTFKGMTVDEAIAYWEAQAKKTDEIESALKVYEENSDLLANDEDFVFIRYILMHPERDRLRLINDGSYYTHRIWFHVNNDGFVTVSPSICWMDSAFKRMSNQLSEKPPREKVDFLFNHFEVVYIQMPIAEGKEDIERWIREERMSRDMSSLN